MTYITRLRFTEFERSAIRHVAELTNNRLYRPTDRQLTAFGRSWSAGISPEDAAVLVALDILGEVDASTN